MKTLIFITYMTMFTRLENYFLLKTSPLNIISRRMTKDATFTYRITYKLNHTGKRNLTDANNNDRCKETKTSN